MPTDLELVEAQVMRLSPPDRARLLQRLRLIVPVESRESHTDAAIVGSPAQSWAQEHAEFVAAYSLLVEKEGLALDEWRNF